MLLPRYDVELREIVWLTNDPSRVIEEAKALSFIPSYAELLENLDEAVFVYIEE